MDDTERALVAGICAAPADDTARLVYADYLDERERHERAEFIRVQVALTQCGNAGNCPRCNVALSPLRKDRFPLLAGCTKCGYQGGFWSDAVKDAKEEASLRAREKALFGHAGTPGFFDALPGAYRNADSARMQITTADQLKYTVRRGFVSELECSAANFLKHADALVWNPKQTVPCGTCCGTGLAEISEWGCLDCGGIGHMPGRGTHPRPCPETAQPITKVVLTTAPECTVCGSDDGYYYWCLGGVVQWDGNTIRLPRGGEAGAVLPLLEKRFPDIEFELPEYVAYGL